MDFNTKVLLGWFEEVVDWCMNNKSKVLNACGALVIVGLGFGVYRYMALQTRIAAHKELVQFVRMIEEPLQVGSDIKPDVQASLEEDKWSRIAQAGLKNYQEFKGTAFGAAFLVYRADALDKLGKYKDALDAMRQAVQATSVQSIRDFYQLKLALMLLDQEAVATSKEGLELLLQIAKNAQNSAHDRALYHLGEYFWIKKDFSQAKNYWQQFIVKYGTEKALFALVEKAKERLELLAV